MQFVKKKYDNETLYKILKHVKYICWLKKKGTLMSAEFKRIVLFFAPFFDGKRTVFLLTKFPLFQCSCTVGLQLIKCMITFQNRHKSMQTVKVCHSN